MQEIRFHGRGGQGAVIASKIMAQALFYEGLYAQAFPTFGAERRGAPVAAFVRADRQPVRLRSRVTTPNHVVVMAARLIEVVPVTEGLKENGTILINSSLPATKLALPARPAGTRTVVIDFNRIALEHGLGSVTMPLINAPILGALARITGLVSADSLVRALPHFIPARLEENRQALLDAFTAAPLTD